MKHGGHKRRREPVEVEVMDATEEEALGVSKQIAMGLATPMLAAGFSTPGPGRAPTTPAGPSAQEIGRGRATEQRTKV